MVSLLRARIETELERDAQTAALIAAIRELKATTPATPTVPPPDCAHDPAATQGRHISPSTLNGTYRWRLTKAGSIAAGTGASDPDIGIVSQITLRDGKWLLQEAGVRDPDAAYSATYELKGNRIIFDWPQVASTLTFTFTRHANGDLDIKPVLPMDPGDRFNWASAPWRRIGPPVSDIP